jgi:aspartate/methionine/tyrosine aminotransferase
VAALSDETHVEHVRAVYRRKRDTLLPLLERKGLQLVGGDATFYLWLAVGGASEAFARRLLDAGVLVSPGSFFGADGEGCVRMALVPTQAECERAAEILEDVL